jgi:hypothetical protein
MCLQLKMQTIKFLIKMLKEDYNFENVFFSISNYRACKMYNLQYNRKNSEDEIFSFHL